VIPFLWIVPFFVFSIGSWPIRLSAQQSQQERMAELAAEEEAYAIGVEAYLYGYPRVEIYRRIWNETRRVAKDQVIFAPVNHFFYFDRLAKPGDGKVIKAPNNDTLYGSAYLDLSQGPVLLRVPSMGDRYYVALVVDARGSIDTRIGSRVTGSGPIELAFVGPGSDGVNLPPGVRRLPQRANDLWLLMRVASSGGNDEAIAAQMLKQFTLHRWISESEGWSKVADGVDVSDWPIESPCEPMGSIDFYHALDRMLQRNPVPLEDRGLLDRWSRIGVGQGGFDASRLTLPLRRGLERAIESGKMIVSAGQFGIANSIDGWNFSDKIGQIRNDWALSAAIAMGGFGNRMEDSVYHQRNHDANGLQLSGSHAYRMTFLPGRLPPVGAFWSITAYDQNQLDLMENPIQRFSLGDRTEGLRYSGDGSLTIAIQRKPPEDPMLMANWLPVGDAPFYLIFRSYDPAEDIMTGRWAPPQVTLIE
jgi:hypothetical protein